MAEGSDRVVPTVQPVHVDDALHFPTLDGVRFLAYFAVFLSHTVPRIRLPAWAPGFMAEAQRLFESGAFGVDLFLVLSAFLITSLLLHEHARTGTIRVRWFYVRRALRIWPLYLTFLASMLVASYLLPGLVGFKVLDVGYWVSFLFLVGNWYTGLNGYPASNISPLWSVSLEEQFYLFWPLLLLAFRKHLVKACFALLAVSVLSRVAVVLLGLPHPAMWTFTITRLDPIVLGALLAVGLRRGVLPQVGHGPQIALLLSGFALWPLAIVLAGKSFADGKAPGIEAALLSLPVAALASAGILLAAVQSTGPVRRFFSARFLVRMGSLSYGTYVFHLLMVRVAMAVLEPWSSLWFNLLLLPLSFSLSWLAAEASYRWLEAPFLRMRKRFRPAAAQTPPETPTPRKEATP